jgi:serine/threonine-protein kinase
MAIAYKHLSDRVPRPSALVPDLPADVDAFVASATERDRELRPESAREMRRDLEAIARELPAVRSLEALVAEAGPVVQLPAIPDEAATTTVTIRAERTKRRRARRVLGALLLVAALAAAAWGAWTYLLPHRVEVPPLAGVPVEAARARLQADGLVVRIAKGQYNLRYGAGHVISVSPAPGTALGDNAVVTIVPSLGPRPLPVPSLQGETVATARQALSKDFRVDPTLAHAFSPDVPEGRVIDTRPRGGTTAPEQSLITIVVSKGPPPRPVPGVVGKDVADAKAALTAQGFHVAVVERFNDRIPLGQVIAQDPGANVTKPYGTAVTLTVSKGPKAFPVATYIGLSKDAAIAAIEGDGLVADVSYVPSGVSGKVVGQSPDPGTTVHPGDTITIFVA